MSDLDARIAAAKSRYQALRDDPSTPQGLTAMGQSGSALDYQESAEIGAMICAEKGHRTTPTDWPQPGMRFCSCCGQRLEAGAFLNGRREHEQGDVHDGPVRRLAYL